MKEVESEKVKADPCLFVPRFKWSYTFVLHNSIRNSVCLAPKWKIHIIIGRSWEILDLIDLNAQINSIIFETYIQLESSYEKIVSFCVITR